MNIYEEIQNNLSNLKRLDEKERNSYEYEGYDGLSKMKLGIIENSKNTHVPISDRINILNYVRDYISKTGYPLYMPSDVKKKMSNYYNKSFDNIRGLYYFQYFPMLFKFLYENNSFRNKITDYTEYSVADYDYDEEEQEPVKSEPTESEPVKSESEPVKSEPVKSEPESVKSEPVENRDVSSNALSLFNLLWNKTSSSAKDKMKTFALNSNSVSDFKDKLLSQGNADIFKSSMGDDLAYLFYKKFVD